MLVMRFMKYLMIVVYIKILLKINQKTHWYATNLEEFEKGVISKRLYPPVDDAEENCGPLTLPESPAAAAVSSRPNLLPPCCCCTIVISTTLSHVQVFFCVAFTTA